MVLGKCQVCDTEYMYKEFGIKEDTCDLEEKYVKLKGEWILLGIAKNVNRDNFSFEVKA
jgi:hypothetical protein